VHEFRKRAGELPTGSMPLAREAFPDIWQLQHFRGLRNRGGYHLVDNAAISAIAAMQRLMLMSLNGFRDTRHYPGMVR
jgi:hypothetical protein